jgi:hypothetical protein
MHVRCDNGDATQMLTTHEGFESKILELTSAARSQDEIIRKLKEELRVSIDERVRKHFRFYYLSL